MFLSELNILLFSCFYLCPYLSFYSFHLVSELAVLHSAANDALRYHMWLSLKKSCVKRLLCRRHSHFVTLTSLFPACQTLFMQVSQIKRAFVGVHACIRPSVCSCVCVRMCVLCVIRGPVSSLMCSPAFRLYVKPLHCSTASGISAGTALFFSLTLHPHNREIKFGLDPSCVESSSLTHAHLPVFIRHAPESAGQLRAPKSLL